MRAIFSLALIALPLFFIAGCASQEVKGDFNSPYFNLGELKENEIVHLATGRTFTEAELVDYLSRFNVIYIGEAHDSVNDHAAQLKILKGLYDKFPGQIALGMEMLRLPYQEAATKWSSGELSEKDFLREWTKSWGQYEYYKEILGFVREKKIPLVALNREKSKKPMGELPAGHAPVEKKAEEAKPAPPSEPEVEIDENDPYYEAYIDSFFAGHGEMGPDVKRTFLLGQLKWDETMADSAARFLKANPGKKIVILAGGNHVRYGFGIPRRVFRRVPEPYAIVEPVIVQYPEEKKDRLMDVDPPSLPLRTADFIWPVTYKDLADEKIMLGVMIQDSTEPVGVKVNKVMDGSTAQKAGIAAEDVITSIDGAEIKEVFDLSYEIQGKKKGQEGSVTVLRGGETKILRVTFDVIEQPKEKEKP